MTQIDIAKLLISAAGKQLTHSYEAYKKKDITYEIEECIQALILFQAGMEAIINDEITNHPLLSSVKSEESDLNTHFKSLSFKNKWTKSYEALQIREFEYLEAYLDFYSQYRIPITHPKRRYVSLSTYRFRKIYEGIENGWYAVQLLYAVLGKELTSWELFCKEYSLVLLDD